MSDFWASLVSWYKERTTSSLYGTYLISFFAWNWQIAYTYLLQPKGVILVPTAEYVQSNLLLFSGTHIWYQNIANDCWIVIPPMIFAFLIIKFIPPVNKWAFDLNTKHFYERKNVEDEAKLDYEKTKNKNLQELVEIKQEQNTNKNEIKKNTSEEELWDEDYEKFKQIDFAWEFSKIIESLYKKRGIITDINEFNGKVMFEIPEDILAYAHSNGLVEIDQSTDKINTTDKGKYFINKFLGDPTRPSDIPF